MKKNFSKLILPVLLVLALGYAFISFLPPPQEKKEVSTSTSLPLTPKPKPKTVETPKPAEAIAADPFAMRAPIRRKDLDASSAQKEAKPADPIKLMGILKNEGISIAIISGQSVTLGSAIRGWRVVSIQEDRVVLQQGEKVKILKMEEK